MHRKPKILFIIGGLFVLVIIILGIVAVIQNNSMVNLKIEVIPRDSTLSVDGVVTEPGTVAVTKGVHTLKAQRQYFTDAVQKIDTNKINTADTITLMPTPDSQQAIDWLNSNPGVQKSREAAGAAQAAEASEDIQERYPFINQLPRSTLGYTIDYTLDSNRGISFQITVFPRARAKQDGTYDAEVAQYKTQALEFLSQIGVNTKEAKITFTITPQ
jgi:hypothetical protein